MSHSWTSISSKADLEGVLSGSIPEGDYYVIFKHSTRCAISTMAKSRLERGSDNRIKYFIVDVIKNREVSNALAELTEVRHESPQSFLFNGPYLIDVKSHMGIDPTEISKRLDSLIQTRN